jgi:hypothetical protein
MTKYCETFCIEEHKHRFAAWAAARAAATKGVRFTVAQGKQVLEAIGLPREPEQLPLPFEMEGAPGVA